MRGIVNSILILLLGFHSFGQYNSKKYIKKNRKAPSYRYANSNIYARALHIDGERLFIGNSDGSMYYLNLNTNQNNLIFKLADFDELRDIHKVDDHIIGMHSGKNGKLVSINLNGGMKIIRNEAWNGVFMDGMDFYGNTGFIMGDPVDTTISLFHTKDGGFNWLPCEGKIKAIKGEAGFAASGTTVKVLNDSTYAFVTGGQASRFFKSTDSGKTWYKVVLPYYPGESTGAYSMSFANDSIGVIVGGDYRDPELRMNVNFYTFDGGESWFNSENPVRGYRSCVYHHDGVFYTCGRNGIDFSINGGKDWIPFADGPYFSLTVGNDKLIATSLNGTLFFFDLIKDK